MQTENLSDEELMVLYQKGNFTAFETLYYRHSGRLFEYLKKKVQSKETAQDLLQEVFSKVHKSRQSYREQFPFLPWIFTIARNTAFDFFKQKESLLNMQITPFNSLAETGAEAWIEGNHHSANKTNMEVILAKLPLIQKKAIEHRYLEEWSFERIASEIGTSEDNVRQLISRGLKKLRLHWLKSPGGEK